MNTVFAFLRARLRTFAVLLVLVLAVYGLIAYGHATQARWENVLAGTSQDARDEAVRGLVGSGRLPDVLLNTQTPDDADKSSPHNVRSLLIRKNALDSVNRLIASGKITPTQAMDTLFALSKDGDLKDGAETGLAGLGKGSAQGLSSIVSRFTNGDPDIRGAAVDVLAKIGGPQAAQAADGALADPNARDSAVGALQKIGAASVPFIVAHLNDSKTADDIAFRQQMVGLLDQIAAPAGVPALIALAAKTDQPAVQRSAQVALADTVYSAPLKTPGVRPQVQAAEPTLSAVLGDTEADSEARTQAALALGSLADPVAVRALVGALGDFDSRVRDSALTGVQAAGPAAVGPLLGALAGSDPNSRAGAAQALGGIGTPPALVALNAAVSDPSTPDLVREGAIQGLGRSGRREAIPTLVRALGDPDGAVAAAASEGLLDPALEKDAVPALVAAFSQPTPIPFNASDTLSRMGALTESDVVPALTQAAASGDAGAQTWAAVTLGQIGSKDAPAVAALQRLSGSPDAQVKYAASQSLLKLTGA